MKKLLLVVAFLSGCTCVTKDDYRALLDASKAYQATVSTTFRSAVERAAETGEIAPQSRENRLKADDDFRAALSAAQAFVDGAPVGSSAK